MRKRRTIWKRCVAVGLAAAMCLGLAACGESNDGESNKGMVTVDFLYSGDLTRIEAFKTLVDEFNDTVGPELGVRVKGIPKTASLTDVLAQQLPSNSGPDVFITGDEGFKKYARYLDDLTGHIDQSVLDGVYEQALYRYRYDIQTTTSNADDPLLGLPAYGDAVILYYNKEALENNGIICISVNEEDLDEFNAGTKADNNGKTKADYGITVDVPKKGFYRSLTPFVPAENERDGASWKMPTSDEVLIFNDCIAMNWDEVEDLGLICTKERNPASETQYGFYTEWWFSYGWAVGGDCIEDMSGDGDWTFALAGENPNYIVGEGKTYTGQYTGYEYKENETLDVKDIIQANPEDTISYITDNASYFHYTVNGEEATYRDFSAQIADGTLTELPKIREAFQRFCSLAGIGGLNVCPTPTIFANGGSSLSYFMSGELALLEQQTYHIGTLQNAMPYEWGIAPLPVYKVYTDPTDPNCDTVLVQGADSTFSFGNVICVNDKSQVKEAAYKFVSWVASDGQGVLAENGYQSVRPADVELMLENFDADNPWAIIDCLSTAKAGDWWYMPDTSWIEYWANPLNYEVRNAEMSFEEFLYSYIEQTNEALENYKQ